MNPQPQTAAHAGGAAERQDAGSVPSGQGVDQRVCDSALSPAPTSSAHLDAGPDVQNHPDTFKGHGWAIIPQYGEEKPGMSLASLHIGQLQGRKQVCLYGHNGNPSVITVYAYFRSRAQAAEALRILDRLMKK